MRLVMTRGMQVDMVLNILGLRGLGKGVVKTREFRG